jgi:hypothetical protein
MPGRALALALLLAASLAGAARAEPLRRDQVPEALQEWIDWAFRPDARCCRFSVT